MTRSLAAALAALLVAATVPAADAATELWSDDFDDGDDAGWTRIEGTWSVVDSAYRCVTTGDGRSIAGDSTWTDYLYEGRFLFDPSDPGEATLLFRVQDAAPGADQGHYFQLAHYESQDEIRFHRISNGANLLAQIPYPFEPETWYSFVVEAWGPFVRYWIDGDLVLTHETASAYSEGRIGVKAWQSTARFDDLSVTTIDPPTAGEAIVRGVEYLRSSALAWQGANQCNGCHVQAQAVRAIGGALARGFDVDSTGLGSLVNGMITLAEGQEPDGCFRDDGAGSVTDDTVWGAAGLADYDWLVSPDRRAELVDAADCLVAEQQPDGRVPEDYGEPPINQGDGMTTGMSAVVWDYAHRVTGDPAYAAALDDAEAWLRSEVPALVASPQDHTTQDKVMPLFGLLAAGVAAPDSDLVALRALVVSEQGAGGGWRLAPATGGANGYATGQALLALERTGADSTTLASAVDWLLANQSPSGAWSAVHWTGARPSTFASTMWPVLALLQSVGGTPTAVEWVESTGRLLLQVTPNPSPGRVAIRFQGAGTGRMRLEIYDVRGRRVRTLAATGVAGAPGASWDRRGDDGRAVGAGVYFVRAEFRGRVATAKVTLR